MNNEQNTVYRSVLNTATPRVSVALADPEYGVRRLLTENNEHVPFDISIPINLNPSLVVFGNLVVAIENLGTRVFQCDNSHAVALSANNK